MKSIRSVLFSFTLMSVSAGCSSSSTKVTPENIHSERETLVILGTNDIHGGIAPLSLKTRDQKGHKETHYEAGGVSVIASFVKQLRSEFGSHFIWLDGGDEFQGSIESNLDAGAPMVQFFNASGLTAAAVGNHEFDFGLVSLKTRMKEAHYPYLAANISDIESGKLADFPNTHSHILIQAGNLKVGVIGLSTIDTPTTTRAINVSTLHFDDLKTATLREAEALRKLGAQVVLLTAHAGLKCDPGINPGRLLRKASDIQGPCGDQDEMVQLLRVLPPNTVDAVVSGHTHQIVHHWVSDVPVIQAGAFGRYLNVIYLTYDWSQKKVIPDQTRIEGPIPVCTQVFQNQNDCNGDRPAPKNGRGPLVPFVFHGTAIKPDPEITALLAPTLAKSKLAKEKVLGTAATAIEHPRFDESPLGNLVADALRASLKADFGYINSGGVRAPLEEGLITYGSVFRSLPFDNQVVRLQVTAKELKMILRVALSGSRGYGSISGLRVKLVDPKYDAPFSDLNNDDRTDLWESNRLLEVTLPNDQPLDPHKLYTLATIDFLVTGGDDLKWPMSQIPAERIDMNAGKVARESVVQYVSEMKVINDEQHLLVDPNNRRIQFVKPKVKAKHRKGKKRKVHSL